jgi:hypothetical protein
MPYPTLKPSAMEWLSPLSRSIMNSHAAEVSQEFAEWTSQTMLLLGTFNLVGKTLVLRASKLTMNNSHVYAKMFHLLGVDSLEVIVVWTEEGNGYRRLSSPISNL